LWYIRMGILSPGGVTENTGTTEDLK